MPRNEFAERELLDAIKLTCREAVAEGVTPTHVGLHPEDMRRLRDFKSSKHYVGEVEFYDRSSVLRTVEMYSDEGIPEGHANVVNREAAFVAGYIDDPGIGLEESA